MSLQFIIGSSGSGKTRILYENLISRSLADPQARFIAIVPEQFTMQTQKEIVCLHPDHGTMNIDIVSFNRLAYRVFEELAVEHLEVLDDMGKSMVLRKVVSEQKKNLRLYAGHLNQTGFINQLKSMLSELYQYGVRPEDLENISGMGNVAMQDAGTRGDVEPQGDAGTRGDVEPWQSGEAVAPSDLLRAKCGDLARIYRAFQEAIEKRYITTEEILDVLCRILPQSRLIKESVVTLDGYTGFTPVQYRLLGLLMCHARQVVVTVTMDPSAQPYRRGKMQNLFYMGKEMIGKLTELAVENGVARDKDLILGADGKGCPVRFASGSSLAFIEKHLYRYGESADWVPEELEVWQAVSPAEEVALTAERIHFLVQKEGIRYREIAVITGDLPGYRHEVANRFQLEEIPFFMDYKKSVLENAMVEWIRAALEAVRRDFDYESVFRYLKTGLVTEDHEEMDRLENYCIAMGVRGFKRWSETWEDGYRGAKNLNLDQLNAFREEVFAPLAALREAARQEGRTVGSMNEALLACIRTCGIREKLEEYRDGFERSGQYSLAKEYDQVYDRVMELFGRLTALLGKEKVGLKEYAEILDAGFGEIQVGVIPATVDRVVVGDITRTRLDGIRVLFFVGVNEGIVPSRKDSQSLLTDMDREMFKRCQIELAPTSKEDSFTQRYYLYLMMTKPSDRLILSYSLMDAAGKSRRPSSLVGELRRMFPRLEVKEAGGRPGETASKVAAKERLIRGLRKYAADGPDGEGQRTAREAGADFLEMYRWFAANPKYSHLARRLTDAAFYSYEERGISKAAAQALYGKVMQGSVTRLEQYAACAYAHFLAYGLELTKRQEYRIEAVDMGNLFHSSIDLCFKEMDARGIKAAQLDDSQRRELVRECVGQVAEKYGGTILQSSARNRYLTERIERMTERTIWALTQQLRKGDFEPVGYEVSFSETDDLKAMKIRLSEEEALHLSGRVDRMDICEDGKRVYVKIIDYKSGGTQFDLAAVYYGLQLQLVVYLDAAAEMAERSHPGKDVVCAGIFYYNIKDPLVDRQSGQTAEEVDAEILRQLRMNGLVNSDLEVIRHLDSQIQQKSDVIPVAVRDGLVQEDQSSVASSEKFDILRRYVRRQLAMDGREILAGKASVRPQKNGNRSACDYCIFHGVCGFDTRIEGYRYRRFAPIDKEQIWDRMKNEDAVD